MPEAAGARGAGGEPPARGGNPTRASGRLRRLSPPAGGGLELPLELRHLGPDEIERDGPHRLVRAGRDELARDPPHDLLDDLLEELAAHAPSPAGDLLQLPFPRRAGTPTAAAPRRGPPSPAGAAGSRPRGRDRLGLGPERRGRNALRRRGRLGTGSGADRAGEGWRTRAREVQRRRGLLGRGGAPAGGASGSAGAGGAPNAAPARPGRSGSAPRRRRRGRGGAAGPRQARGRRPGGSSVAGRQGRGGPGGEELLHLLHEPVRLEGLRHRPVAADRLGAGRVHGSKVPRSRITGVAFSSGSPSRRRRPRNRSSPASPRPRG